MTADSPDKGTPEYNRMIAHLLFTSETEISEKGSRRHFAMTAPTRYFAEITGGLAKDTSRTALARQLLVGQNYLLLPYIEDLYRITVLDNLLSAYQENRISKELLEILEAEPGKIPPDYGTDDKAVIIANLMKEGKTDFEPFRRKHDIEPNWYMFYRLDFAPLPLYRHSIKQLEAIQKGKRQRKLRAIKAIIRGLLEGHPAIDDIPAQPPKNPAYAGKLAELIEGQYDLRIKEKTPLDWASPYKNVSAGFYINPATGEVKDLRDFTGEINALLSLKSWDYLKEAADAIREAIEEVKNEQLKEQPVKADIQKADKINYPVDKVNNNLWGTLENTSDGQLAFSTVKTGKQKEVTILAAINFVNMEGVKITKKLTNFDKRVYIAVAALWNAGNKVITLTQIHYAMGNTKRPSKNQLEKINEAVSKMTTAKLFLDNALEVEKLKYNYGKFKYDGALLPMERMTATIKGQLSDAAIHIFREPPLMTFARERNQITTFDVKLLQSPVSKTDGNLAIEDYLLERIAGAKQAASKGKKVVINTILYETLFQKVGIDGRMQRARAIEKIKTYLDYYKSNGYIKSYVAEAKQVTFYF